jgi:hypothetical protein
MPAKSKAQDRLMRAVAHSPEFAAKVKIPQSVGQEFAAKTSAALRSRLPSRTPQRR